MLAVHCTVFNPKASICFFFNLRNSKTLDLLSCSPAAALHAHTAFAGDNLPPHRLRRRTSLHTLADRSPFQSADRPSTDFMRKCWITGKSGIIESISSMLSDVNLAELVEEDVKDDDRAAVAGHSPVFN